MAKKNILIFIVIGIVILSIGGLFFLNQAKVIQLTAIPVGMSVEQTLYPFPRDWDILENKLIGKIVLPEGADLKNIYAAQFIGKGCGYDINFEIKDGVKTYSSVIGLPSCHSLFYADSGSSDETEYQHYKDFQKDFRLNGLNSKTVDYSISLTQTDTETAEMLYPFKIYIFEMVSCRVNTQCNEILMPGTNIKVQTICDQVYHSCRIPTNTQERIEITQPINVAPPIPPGEDRQITPPYVEPPKPPTKINLGIIIGIFLLIIGSIIFIFRKDIFKRK